MDFMQDEELKDTLKQEEEPKAPEAAPELYEVQSLNELKKKSDDYLNQIIRLQAEFANYRKRTEKEKADAIRFGRVLMTEKMISFLDIMEEALKHALNATEIESLKKGFQMVVQEFSKFLKSEGMESFKTVGEKFDPHLHEAVDQIETDEEDQNNVIFQEVQKGYLLNGQLFRPAKVKVAKIKIQDQKE